MVFHDRYFQMNFFVENTGVFIQISMHLVIQDQFLSINFALGNDVVPNRSILPGSLTRKYMLSVVMISPAQHGR